MNNILKLDIYIKIIWFNDSITFKVLESACLCMFTMDIFRTRTYTRQQAKSMTALNIYSNPVLEVVHLCGSFYNVMDAAFNFWPCLHAALMTASKSV